jgi:signal transduction histidine kinase
MESLERHLKRLTEIQKETRQIFRVTSELEADSLIGEMEHLVQKVEHFSDMSVEMSVHWNAVKEWLRSCLPSAEGRFRPIRLYPFVERVLKDALTRTPHRRVDVRIRGAHTLQLLFDVRILKDVLDGLIKNAVENTPDEGRIEVAFEEKEGKIRL